MSIFPDRWKHLPDTKVLMSLTPSDIITWMGHSQPPKLIICPFFQKDNYLIQHHVNTFFFGSLNTAYTVQHIPYFNRYETFMIRFSVGLSSIPRVKCYLFIYIFIWFLCKHRFHSFIKDPATVGQIRTHDTLFF